MDIVYSFIMFLLIIIPVAIVISDEVKSFREVLEVKRKLNDFAKLDFKQLNEKMESNYRELRDESATSPNYIQKLKDTKHIIEKIDVNEIDPLKKIQLK